MKPPLQHLRRLAVLIIGGQLICSVGFCQTQAEQTQAAWQKWLATKKAIEDSGFNFDVEKLALPPIPDDENFAKHPLIAELFTKESRENPKTTRLGKIDFEKLAGIKGRFLIINIHDPGLTDLAAAAGDPQLDRSEAAKKLLDGLATWDGEISLLLFEEMLADFDFANDYHTALRWEFAFSETLSIQLAKGELDAEYERLMSGFFGGEIPPPDKIYDYLEESLRTTHKLFIAPGRKPATLDAARLSKIKKFINAPEPSASEWTAQSLASYYSFALMQLRHQAYLNNARIAIAIERFRLRHGRLPDKLSELTPRYLRELPTDPLTGKVPLYQSTPVGEVIIYSFGADGDDDGGRPTSRDEEIGESDGDWVWRTAAPSNERP